MLLRCRAVLPSLFLPRMTLPQSVAASQPTTCPYSRTTAAHQADHH
jgi:hypothetical protein